MLFPERGEATEQPTREARTKAVGEAIADDDLSRQCERLLAILEKNCPGLIPPGPLPPGEVTEPLDVPQKDLGELVLTALGVTDKRQRHQIVWEEAGSQLLVHMKSVRVAVLDGLVAAFNAEDFTAFSSYFTCDTIYRSDITDTGSAGGSNPSNQTLCDIGEETLERSMRFRAAKAQELTVLDCMTLEEGTTRCEIVLGGPFFGLRGGVRGSLEIATTDGMLDLYAIETYAGQTEMVELPFRNCRKPRFPQDRQDRPRGFPYAAVLPWSETSKPASGRCSP